MNKATVGPLVHLFLMTTVWGSLRVYTDITAGRLFAEVPDWESGDEVPAVRDIVREAGRGTAWP